MADQKVNIKVTTQGATKAKQEMGGLSGSISNMGKAVGLASAAYFGARGLISGFSSVITLAGEQEQAEKRLEVALGKTSQALLNQASALQKMTVFGDESIIGVQASIAAFVDSEDQIKKATEATLDMAVAMGMDLKGAGDLIAKTLGSSTNALSRYGIEVTGAVGSTERLESLTSNVADLFGGQAKAQAETMAGALDQAKNSAGDLGEAIGRKLSPLVKILAGDLALSAEKLKELIEPTEISADDKLNDLLLRRKELMDGIIPGDDDTVKVDDFFNAVLSARGVTEEELFTPLDALDEEINKYNELLFAKQPLLELNRLEFQGLENIQKVSTKNLDLQNSIAKAKHDQITADLKSAALSGQTAIGAMKSVVRAETMEAVSGYISSVLKGTPYPLNLILAAGGGGLVAGLMDKALSSVSAETGFEGVVTKPTMFLTGENNKPEQVSVTPLGGASASGITVNISAPLVDDTVVESIIPAIERAKRMNLA